MSDKNRELKDLLNPRENILYPDLRTKWVTYIFEGIETKHIIQYFSHITISMVLISDGNSEHIEHV